MKPYPSYKPTTHEWSDSVPEHWKETRLKYIGYLYSGLTGKKGDDFKLEPDSSTKPFIPFTNVANNEKINIDNLQYVSIVEGEEQNQVKNGDLFFMMSSENFDDVGKTTILNDGVDEVYLNSFCKGFRLVDTTVDPMFLNYLLLSHPYRKRLMIEANGFTRINLKMGKVNDLKIYIPTSQAEQNKISEYLDHKTAKIDKLIKDKEQLVVVLKEERTAVINQAVTKGIEAANLMKFSGIDWLGEIPEHWGIVKIKYVSSIKYGLGQPPKQKDGGMKIIRATNIFRGIIKEDNMVYVDPDDIPWNRDPVLKEDDIIIVRSGAYTGDSAIITKDYAGSITGYDIVVRAKTVYAQFLAYALLSTYLLDNQLFLERLRAAQPHLNAEEIGNCFLLEPPISEQISIVNHIKNEHLKIDELIEKVKHEIIFLKEYKAALISEVVTGKVDVQNEVISDLLATA